MQLDAGKSVGTHTHDGESIRTKKEILEKGVSFEALCDVTQSNMKENTHVT